MNLLVAIGCVAALAGVAPVPTGAAEAAGASATVGQSRAPSADPDVARLAGPNADPTTGQPASPAVGQNAPSSSEAIGSVRTVNGDAVIVRGGRRLPAQIGTRLLLHDVLQTGQGGSLGVVLRDDTAIALGPSSELALKEYAFKPAEGVFASLLAMARGTMVYITGRIAKLAPDAVKVETPAGVAAVRGTKVLIEVPARGKGGRP